jgi:hypothetical protein
MGALFVKVGSSWVPVSGGTEEVFVGPTDPGLSSAYDLWIDSDAPAQTLPAPSAYAWNSQCISVSPTSGTVQGITQAAPALADGFHLGTAAGVAFNTAICDQPGRYYVDAWISFSAAVAGNIWSQLEIRVVRAAGGYTNRIFVGPPAPNGGYAGIGGTAVFDLLAGDAIVLYFTPGGTQVTIDARTWLTITSTGGAKGLTGPASPVGVVAPPVLVFVDQAGVSANADLTGFSITFNVVSGRWYEVTYALGTYQASVAGTQIIRISLDGAEAILSQNGGVPVGDLRTYHGSMQFSGGVQVGSVPMIAAGTRTIKLRGSVASGSMTIGNASYVNGRFAIKDIGPVT